MTNVGKTMKNKWRIDMSLDSYSKARMGIMVKDEIPNLLQDIQRTYIFDFMPEKVHSENHIICSYCSKTLKIMLMMTICFIIKKKHIVLFVFS